jgi:serine/threonine-protein kinase
MLGRGGFGTVYRARESRLQREVALKVPQPVSSERFLAEARSMATLQHDNIVTVYDTGELEGTPYVAMELIKGNDLESLVRDRGRLPLTDAVVFASQAARGLAYAHGHGVLHRNVTPGNLFIDNNGKVKITDFGLASLFERGGQKDDSPVSVVGTPAYLAPEQAVGASIGPAADVYSLGCTLFYAATGNPPTSGSAVLETLKKKTQEAPRLSTLVPEAPPELDALLHEMLAKRPEERPTMHHVAEELDSIARELAGIPTTEALAGTLPSADVTIGLSLTVSTVLAMVLSMFRWNTTAFLVLVGTLAGIHAACWLFIEGFKDVRSVGFRIAAFMSGVFLLWEVMQLLMALVH